MVILQTNVFQVSVQQKNSESNVEVKFAVSVVDLHNIRGSALASLECSETHQL